MEHRLGPDMKRQEARGFTLIELMIVVAILLVLAALAIPMLLRSKMAANEAAAVGGTRVIIRAEVAYAIAFNSGYSADLFSLGPPAAIGTPPSAARADLIDSSLSGFTPGTTIVTRTGYLYTYTPQGSFPDITAYQVTAAPAIPGSTGNRYLFADQSLVIRSRRGAAATVSDTPIPD